MFNYYSITAEEAGSSRARWRRYGYVECFDKRKEIDAMSRMKWERRSTTTNTSNMQPMTNTDEEAIFHLRFCYARFIPP